MSPEPNVETMELRDVLVTNKRPIRRTIFVARVSAITTVGLFQHSLPAALYTLHNFTQSKSENDVR